MDKTEYELVASETILHEGRDYDLTIEDYSLADEEDFSVILRDGNIELYAADFLSREDAELVFAEIKDDPESYI